MMNSSLRGWGYGMLLLSVWGASTQAAEADPAEQARMAVDFPVTTGDLRVQQFVNAGIERLHGFCYRDAEESFRQAAQLEPGCAMAWWGMALASLENETRARKLIRTARSIRDHRVLSVRETMYIDALHAVLETGPDKPVEREREYTRALQRIVRQFPTDLDAKAFLALQLWRAGRDSENFSPDAVDALLRQVLAANPRHPSHFYRMLIWADEAPEMALDSAEFCRQVLPDSPAMWAAAGELYTRLHRYRDAAWHQEAAVRAANACAHRTGLLPDQIEGYARTCESLVENLSRSGRAEDAVALAQRMIELPRHPSFNSLDGCNGSGYCGRRQLFAVLSRYELWDDLIALADTMYLGPVAGETAEVERLRALGRAYFRKAINSGGESSIAAGEAQLAALERLLAEQKFAVKQAADNAEAKKRAELRTQLAGSIESAQEAIARSDAEPIAALFEPSDEEIEKHIEQQFAAELRQARSSAQQPFAARAAEIQTACLELQGLAAIARDNDCGEGLELLAKAGDVDPLFLARVHRRAGRTDEAENILMEQVAERPNEILPLAHLVQLRWELDRKVEAEQAFRELRALSAGVDLDAPPLARLAGIAETLGHPKEWRTRRSGTIVANGDSVLDALGPLAWRPEAASDGTLFGADGKPFSLAQFRGKPTIAVFYLGFGCLHCVEQLKTFGPMLDKFAQAGVQVVGISTEDAESLKRGLDNYGEEPFPFQLLSNAELDAFDAFGAYDRSTATALHGTVLIDGQGLVRWKDVGDEPFMDAEFVLKEARRLLAQRRPGLRGDVISSSSVGASVRR